VKRSSLKKDSVNLCPKKLCSIGSKSTWRVQFILRGIPTNCFDCLFSFKTFLKLKPLLRLYLRKLKLVLWETFWKWLKEQFWRLIFSGRDWLLQFLMNNSNLFWLRIQIHYSLLTKRHDTQHNDTQHNDIQHYNK